MTCFSDAFSSCEREGHRSAVLWLELDPSSGCYKLVSWTGFGLFGRQFASLVALSLGLDLLS